MVFNRETRDIDVNVGCGLDEMGGRVFYHPPIGILWIESIEADVVGPDHSAFVSLRYSVGFPSSASWASMPAFTSLRFSLASQP